MSNKTTTYKLLNTTKLKDVTKRITIIITIALIIISAGFYSLYRINDWFSHNTFNLVRPIEFHNPIQIEKRTTLQVSFSSFKIAQAQELIEAIKWTDRGLSPIGLSD